MPHDISVQGSYLTGNIGDRAIGNSIISQLSASGFYVQMFDKNTEHTNAPHRILGGGGVIHDWYGVDHLRTRLKFLSDTGAILGVGVPGLKTKEARDLIRKELSNIGLVTVRDEWSKQRLQPVYDNQIHVTACPALLHQDPEIKETGQTGVNFCPWFYLSPEVMSYYFDYDEDLDLDRAKKIYLKNIRQICREVKKPVFIPFKKKDEEFARKHLDIEILPYEFSVKQTLERVSMVNQMVAMRYHSLVFATICDTPTLAIAYEPKVSSLADRIGIQSYLPHEQFPIKFEPISNRTEVRQAANENFNLLEKHFND